MPTALLAPATTPPFTKRISNLFDTRFDGERCGDFSDDDVDRYGEDMSATAYWTRCGQRMIAVNGPGGEIELTEDQWRAVFGAMGFTPAGGL